VASHVQIILTQDLANVGKGGELVKVRPGFARNYLVPRGLAIGATEGNVRELEHQKRVAEAKSAKVLSEAQELAQKLSTVSLTISRQVGEGDRLYGSVTHRDIEEALEQKGFVVDRRRIVTEPLKAIGTHEVQIKLAPTVTATIKVEVAAKA
jgi:large subunit ribosomal protein L9